MLIIKLMKKGLFVLALLIISSSVAFAQVPNVPDLGNTVGPAGLTGQNPSLSSDCIVNGVKVPCDQVFEKLKTGLGFGLGIITLFFVVGILFFIFWVMMLVHAIKNPIENKVLWLLLILLTGVIGAIVYYFAVKRGFKQGVQPANYVPPSVPPSTPPTA